MAASTPSATPTPTATPTVDDADELRAAVQDYSDAFLTGDSDAYDMLSKRCKNRTSKESFLGIIDSAKAMYGSALPIKTFDADIQGTLARVTYTYDLRAINQEAEPWVKEGGTWREGDC